VNVSTHVISSNRVIGAITLSDLPIPAALTIIAGLIAMSWWATILVGGGTVVAPLWYFVPIFLAGLRFGSLGALLAGVVTTVLTGPFLPAVIATHTPQATSFWLSRGIFFIILGQFVTQLFAWVRRSSARETRLAFEIELGTAELRLREAARREAEMANAAKSEFLSRMSHELRSPLTAIMGFAELLSHSGLDEKQQQRAALIRQTGDHLSSLVNEVLDLSRIEAGDISISAEPVALLPLIDESLELMRPLADARSIMLNPPEFEADTWYVFADNQRLKQVLINLISNAVKYNRQDGAVRVQVTQADADFVRITVEDTGPGLEPAAVAKLFTPFERLEAAATDVEGTGLGLALSRRLIEAMGGQIGVDSTPGSGSRFWIEARLAEPVAVRRTHTKSDGLLDVREYPAERVLLYIDDTLANITLIEGILEQRPNVRLIPAMLGRLGLELAHQHRPDLILLDIHLPDINGEEVLQQLQADESTRAIPVVILSADATRDRDPLLAAGARAFLTKPIAMRQLLEALDSHLSEPDAR